MRDAAAKNARGDDVAAENADPDVAFEPEYVTLHPEAVRFEDEPTGADTEPR